MIKKRKKKGGMKNFAKRLAAIRVTQGKRKKPVYDTEPGERDGW